MSHSPSRTGPDAQATRGRLLTLLRELPHTVDELADALSLTDNAVRFHLVGLERDGAVERAGVRKPEGAGKPAVLYTISPEADIAFSRAYAPVLAACLEELRNEMPPAALTALLRRVGERLAKNVEPGTEPGTVLGTGSLKSRVNAASALLNQLGGLTTVEQRPGVFRIVGRGCPLGAAVAAEPCLCHAVESLLTQVVGAQVRERCNHTGRPSCCFEIARTA